MTIGLSALGLGALDAGEVSGIEFNGSLPAITGSFEGDTTAAIAFVGTLTAITGSFEAEYVLGSYETTFSATLPALAGIFVGRAPYPLALVDGSTINTSTDIGSVLQLQAMILTETPLTTNTTITLTCTDTPTLTDAVIATIAVSLPTTISVTDDLDAAVAAVLELAILMSAQDTHTSVIEAAVSLLDGLVAQDLLYQLASLDLDETVAIADELSNAIRAHLALPETTALLAEMETAIVIPCSETATLTDAGTISVSAMLNLSDGAAFIARLPLDGADYQAWVMNAETTGTTQYTNFPMNSLFTFQGVPYGVSETGLYQLEGADDDGDQINAVVATGDMNFGTSREKNIPRAYLYLTQTGQVVLKTISSQRGSRHETYYELAERTTDSTDDDTYRRVPLGRGVRGVWWRFEIHALDGATINLAGAEIRPVVLSRRG